MIEITMFRTSKTYITHYKVKGILLYLKWLQQNRTQPESSRAVRDVLSRFVLLFCLHLTTLEIESKLFSGKLLQNAFELYFDILCKILNKFLDLHAGLVSLGVMLFVRHFE